MALTLRTAITANQTTFDVLGSDDLQPGDYKTLDSETIVIRTATPATLQYSESARYQVTVYRGSEGTRKATHAAAATLTTYSAGGGGGSISATDGTTTVDPATSIQFPAGTLSDLGSGVAGVGLAVSLLGPFRVEHDDADLQTGGMLLAAIADGTWLWGVAVIGIVNLEPATGTPEFQVSLAGPAAVDMNGGWVTTAVGDIGGGVNDSLLVPGTGAFEAASFRPVGLKVAGGGLYASLSPDDTPTTAGTWDIYALIATPA